jgi:hypothetical protein
VITGCILADQSCPYLRSGNMAMRRMSMLALQIEYITITLLVPRKIEASSTFLPRVLSFWACKLQIALSCPFDFSDNRQQAST